MDFYTITPVVATTLTFSLALIAFIYRGHGRINTAFAILMINEALATSASIFTATNDIEQYSFGLRISFLFNSTIFFSIFYYVLVLTGYIDRLNEKFFKIKIKYVIVTAAIIIVPIFTILQFTDWLIVGIEPRDDFSFNVVWSDAMLGVNVFSFFMIFYTLVLLFTAYRNTEAGIHRKFLKANSVGILILFTAGPIFGIFLPMMGIDSLPFIDMMTIISSLIFFIAINKHSYEIINELNYGLEQKVEERTRHLRETQTRLVQSEKMASLGRLVAGIAHEINNPIGSIYSSNDTILKANAKLEKTLQSKLGEEYENDVSLKKPISIINNVCTVIRDGGQRVTDIIQRMKRFTQLDEAELQESDIHQGIEDTIAVFNSQLKEGVKINTSFDAKVEPLTCYPAKLNQLILNLIENANKAVDQNGQISILTFNLEDSIDIVVSDNGKGISKDNIERIFEPGFTTWGLDVGVGLGLSICYKIVEEHYGKIEVESEEGKGSTFKINLPKNVEELINENNKQNHE